VARGERFRLFGESKPERFGPIQLLPALSLRKPAVMELSFVESFPPDFYCFEKKSRLAFRTCENLESAKRIDANSRAHIGKKYQYESP
jgi:hypothetical protein